MKKVLLILALFSSAVSWAQEDVYSEAERCYQKGEYKKALDLYDQASASYKQSGDPEKYVRCNLRIAECNLSMGEPKNALVIAESSGSYIDKVLAENKALRAYSMKISGNCHLNLGRNDLAIEYLSKAAELYDPNSLDAAECFEDLGVAYGNNANKILALQFHESALAIRQQFPEEQVLLADSYNNIGLVHAADAPQTSMEYYEKALNIYKTSLNPRHPKIAYVYSNLAFANAELLYYDDALDYLDQVDAIWEETYTGDHPNKAYTLSNRGRVLEMKGDLDGALIQQQEALKMYLRIHGEKHPDVANTYNFIARTYQGKEDYQAAMEQYQAAIYANLFDQTFVEAYERPEIRDYYNADYLLSSLWGKAQSMEALHFTHSLKMRDIDGALKTYVQCDELITQIRRLRQSEADKLKLGQIAFDVYEKGIKASVYLSERIKDRQMYQELAFNFCERSKSAILLEAISETNAKEFGGVPAAEISLEDSLKNEIATLEVQLANASTKEQESRYKRDLFKYQSALREFVARLEEQYPNYYNLKYSQTLATAGDLIGKLPEQKAVISYFTASEEVYAFLITSKGLKIHIMPKSEDFEKTIKGLRNSIKYLLDEEISKHSKTLYQQLIPRIGSRISELVIIPDGALGTIPFEALEFPNDRKDMKYLLEKYNVSYDYSATLLEQRMQMKSYTDERDVLLCAPVTFDGNDTKLGTLVNTETEVKEIRHMFQGDDWEVRSVLRDEASESLLKSGEISSYRYIHLATHGVVNESQPELSRVYLQPSENEDGSLYSSEIYNININADLVTLSACETGVGKISKGEGIVGLSRALMYAGAENIVVSLWPVADESTSLLMIEFYKQHLYHSSNNIFADDLRKAKLSLVNSEKFNNPYYWAPFILVGL